MTQVRLIPENTRGTYLHGLSFISICLLYLGMKFRKQLINYVYLISLQPEDRRNRN
ncbi:hypothetical protein SAMN05216326_1222 [Nitrosomonas marina]|uniref:Uncharacterized protein n=1 Tax=Nitrosomonas marina TaxID=917 RepID=A0A1I0DRI2_9PROT|nr:hypothetical protein SAMN05216326_1222 [Nitrosomonas marina]